MVETSSGALPPQTHTLPIKERVALGRALRDRAARKHHAAWKPPSGRRDPVEILIEQGESRLPDLLPVRYARMRATPFTFLRGAAAVMTADLADTPASGLMVQAAGDCHCLNFGGFATPERRLAFDINDFDETAVAPWEWDVKRLASSFVVAHSMSKARAHAPSWPRSWPAATARPWPRSPTNRCSMPGTAH